MILGIGIDICNVNRVSKTLEKFEKRFEERCFTDLERKKCERSFSKKNCYAKRFAAKEATSKALGTGIYDNSPQPCACHLKHYIMIEFLQKHNFLNT